MVSTWIEGLTILKDVTVFKRALVSYVLLYKLIAQLELKLKENYTVSYII